MKTLIDDLKTMFEAAITAGNITATTVYKGFDKLPNQIPFAAYPYIALDDGGERVEDTNSDTAQRRYYSVIIEFAVYVMSQTTSIDNILDLSNEIEKSANRKKDGHVWGVSIQPFAATDESGQNFFRGRTVIVDYYQLEERAFDY
jgi:hypothetical protein